MVFKDFRFLVILRVMLLLLAIILLAFLLQQAKHIITSVILGGVIVFQVYDLIRYVERTNYKLTHFLESIRHSDFSTSFSDPGMGKSFDQLNQALNDVIQEFKSTRTEKEEHYNYLQTLMQHISIGVIAFRRDGEVDMINNALKRLLRITFLKHLSELAKVKEDLPSVLLSMKSEDKMLVKLFIQDEFLQVSVYATMFRMRGEDFTLVSLQNISSELEEKEIESWQRLIRVLTHEIMNSITPISSLAVTVNEMLFDHDREAPSLKTLDDEDIDAVETALKTIQGRSQGLLNFVETYRNLTRVPKPNFRYFPVKELFDRNLLLLKPKLEQHGIQCSCVITPDNLMLTADPDLVDQVVINLVLNAIDAVKNRVNPLITARALTTSSGRVIIELIDNGHGIKPDIIDKIFMPFFTSKKEGSGIGLSLSRQIMHLHKGTVTVKSLPGEGTTFTLTF
ncbi:MAG TPA: ATP-binding protein [Bacteroidales bacterium]|nr:ATP-binding protein [Bacteroidales bacterium]